MPDGGAVAFEELRPGDHIRIVQRIKVGLKVWTNEVTGRVERTERRRCGLHVKRNHDDFAFQDVILLQRDGATADETTVALDEFTRIDRLP
jgi:hypothetical protein